MPGVDLARSASDRSVLDESEPRLPSDHAARVLGHVMGGVSPKHTIATNIGGKSERRYSRLSKCLAETSGHPFAILAEAA